MQEAWPPCGSFHSPRLALDRNFRRPRSIKVLKLLLSCRSFQSRNLCCRIFRCRKVDYFIPWKWWTVDYTLNFCNIHFSILALIFIHFSYDTKEQALSTFSARYSSFLDSALVFTQFGDLMLSGTSKAGPANSIVISFNFARELYLHDLHLAYDR